MPPARSPITLSDLPQGLKIHDGGPPSSPPQPLPASATSPDVTPPQSSKSHPSPLFTTVPVPHASFCGPDRVCTWPQVVPGRSSPWQVSFSSMWHHTVNESPPRYFSPCKNKRQFRDQVPCPRSRSSLKGAVKQLFLCDSRKLHIHVEEVGAGRCVGGLVTPSDCSSSEV